MDQIREWRIPKSRVFRVFKDNCNRKGRGRLKPARRNPAFSGGYATLSESLKPGPQLLHCAEFPTAPFSGQPRMLSLWRDSHSRFDWQGRTHHCIRRGGSKTVTRKAGNALHSIAEDHLQRRSATADSSCGEFTRFQLGAHFSAIPRQLDSLSGLGIPRPEK
jgi:hypothetical protein